MTATSSYLNRPLRALADVLASAQHHDVPETPRPAERSASCAAAGGGDATSSPRVEPPPATDQPKE